MMWAHVSVSVHDHLGSQYVCSETNRTWLITKYRPKSNAASRRRAAGTHLLRFEVSD